MDLRQIARRFVPCGILLLAAGCTDPMLGLGQPPAEQTLNLATQPSSRAQARPAAPRKGRAKSAASEPAPVGDIFMLYLVRDKASVPTGPYIKAFPLRRAEPAKAVWLMDWLTEPSGQGGSGERQFLIYADSAVLDWAADVAAMVDVRAAASQPAAAPQRADRLALVVASLYAVASPAEISRSVAEDLAGQLEAYSSTPGDPHRRWTASMLAGRLLEDVLGKRKEAASLYERAASSAQPTSPAWLVSRYRQANALNASGDRVEARKIAQDIVKQSGQSYSRVRAYRQAAKLAAEGKGS